MPEGKNQGPRFGALRLGLEASDVQAGPGLPRPARVSRLAARPPNRSGGAIYLERCRAGRPQSGSDAAPRLRRTNVVADRCSRFLFLPLPERPFGQSAWSRAGRFYLKFRIIVLTLIGEALRDCGIPPGEPVRHDARANDDIADIRSWFGLDQSRTLNQTRWSSAERMKRANSTLR